MEGGFSTTLVDALTKEVKEACESAERAFVKIMLHITIINEIERSFERLC